MAEPLNQQAQSHDNMNQMDPSSWLELHRRVRFGDTDAAGVVNFAQLLRWCHEGYEESLERFGVAAAEVFPTPGSLLEVALPIVHCSADYFAPWCVAIRSPFAWSRCASIWAALRCATASQAQIKPWPKALRATWPSKTQVAGAVPYQRPSIAGWKPPTWAESTPSKTTLFWHRCGGP